jgi:hypothetical protein
MGTLKKNPNNLQTKEAKSTRPGTIEKDKNKEYREIVDNREKKTTGDPDEGASDEKPFDAKTNNIHQKR